jgi:hypothetical protein
MFHSPGCNIEPWYRRRETAKLPDVVLWYRRWEAAKLPDVVPWYRRRAAAKIAGCRHRKRIMFYRSLLQVSANGCILFLAAILVCFSQNSDRT